MRRTLTVLILMIFICFLPGCSSQMQHADVVATTLPVYTFSELLCQGTPITVTQLIRDDISCIHDYTLQIGQMRAIESARVVVINGAGLEEFLSDALAASAYIIDSSEGIETFCHEHEHDLRHDHSHSEDPHIWLSPTLAKQMSQNICNGFITKFPEYADIFSNNLSVLNGKLDELQAYGEKELDNLSTRDMITFHEGFSYFAHSFNLHILQSVEEEAGSEASAAKLIELAKLVRLYQLPTIFTETNGSTVSAEIVASECGIPIFNLDMAISHGDYFEIMYSNIDTVKEALG